jgi:hypothetical protein
MTEAALTGGFSFFFAYSGRPAVTAYIGTSLGGDGMDEKKQDKVTHRPDQDMGEKSAAEVVNVVSSLP